MNIAGFDQITGQMWERAVTPEEEAEILATRTIMTADKTVIVSDGIDAATVTVSSAVDRVTIEIDGQPVEMNLSLDNQVVITADAPGLIPLQVPGGMYLGIIASGV